LTSQNMSNLTLNHQQLLLMQKIIEIVIQQEFLSPQRYCLSKKY